jgi:hypothetical protein
MAHPRFLNEVSAADLADLLEVMATSGCDRVVQNIMADRRIEQVSPYKLKQAANKAANRDIAALIQANPRFPSSCCTISVKH